MAKTMRLHGITVTERNDGTYKVSGSIGKNKWSVLCMSFYEAGSVTFEMADNNDFGREINHKMCKVFGRVFFED